MKDKLRGYLPSMVLGWAVKTDGSTTKRVLSTISVTRSPSLGPPRWPSLLLSSYTWMVSARALERSSATGGPRGWETYPPNDAPLPWGLLGGRGLDDLDDEPPSPRSRSAEEKGPVISFYRVGGIHLSSLS